MGHRRGAGVSGLAGEHRHVALDAAGSQHGRGRFTEALQHRPLLDVQLEVRAGAAQALAGLGHPVQVHVVAGDHVLEALPLAVAQVADVVDLERARARRGAEEAASEARALLVGPVDQPQPDRGRVPIGMRAQRLDRGEDPEGAVQPAAGRHRVHVRADDDEAVALPRQLGPEIAGGVDRDLDRQLVQARAQQLARPRPLVCPANPPRAVGAARQAGQLAQVIEDAVGVHHRRVGHAGTPAGTPSERATKRPCPPSVRISPRS